MTGFNASYWSEVIKRPDWYVEFVPYVNKVHEQFGEGSEMRREFHKIIRHFFEKALVENKIALADNGPNLDEQREPIDTIVIHHSGRQNYPMQYMNATQLLNIYAPYFYEPTDKREKTLKGKPIWSNHFSNGKMVFWAYHWLMRMDGKFERLLKDSQIGWHAGNWNINKRSVAICLDNNYEKKDPTDEVLQKLTAHIKNYYPEIKNIIGHCEAREGTICPGTNFLKGWRARLLGYFND